ncbi:Uncharacterised protein [Vibrio cholerae]|nr:Uncharacterised protein [Vibrio cholerae]
MRNIFAFVAVKPRCFDFRVDTNVVTERFIEPLNQLNFFCESRDSEIPFPKRETIRKTGDFIALRINIKPFRDTQGFDFG